MKIICCSGEVSEWLIEPVSKTGVPFAGTAGSNPALSGKFYRLFLIVVATTCFFFRRTFCADTNCLFATAFSTNVCAYVSDKATALNSTTIAFQGLIQHSYYDMIH